MRQAVFQTIQAHWIHHQVPEPEVVHKRVQPRKPAGADTPQSLRAPRRIGGPRRGLVLGGGHNARDRHLPQDGPEQHLPPLLQHRHRPAEHAVVRSRCGGCRRRGGRALRVSPQVSPRCTTCVLPMQEGCCWGCCEAAGSVGPAAESTTQEGVCRGDTGNLA